MAREADEPEAAVDEVFGMIEAAWASLSTEELPPRITPEFPGSRRG
ncbi:hypothetical protein [Amycolatopsis panacis]|nr:hypothetical protein [Amycolatopsis panacis]